MHGIASYLPTRKPSQEEIEECPRYDMTSDAKWEPYDKAYADREERYAKHDNALRGERAASLRQIEETSQERPTKRVRIQVETVQEEQVEEIPDNMNEPIVNEDAIEDGAEERYIYGINTESDEDKPGEVVFGDEDELHTRLVASVSCGSTVTSQRKSTTTPEELSRKWGIGLETAKKTLNATTQRGVRTDCSAPLHRRYSTRRSHLRYPLLKTAVYSDTMFSKVKGPWR
jgi:hypothetical protein